MNSYKKCRNCKTINNPDAQHCIECGAQLGPNKSSRVLLAIIGAVVGVAVFFGVRYALDTFLDREETPAAPLPAAVDPQPLEVGGVRVLDVCGMQAAPDYDLGEAGQYVRDQEVRYCQQGDLFMALSHILYNPDVITNLDGAVQGSIDEIQASADVTDLDCHTEAFTLDGRDARRTTCTFTSVSAGAQGGTEVIYTLDGVSLYMFQAVYPTAGSRYQALVDQAMNSFGYADAQ